MPVGRNRVARPWARDRGDRRHGGGGERHADRCLSCRPCRRDRLSTRVTPSVARTPAPRVDVVERGPARAVRFPPEIVLHCPPEARTHAAPHDRDGPMTDAPLPPPTPAIVGRSMDCSALSKARLVRGDAIPLSCCGDVARALGTGEEEQHGDVSSAFLPVGGGQARAPQARSERDTGVASSARDGAATRGSVGHGA